MEKNIFLIQRPVLIGFLKMIAIQNLLPIVFDTALVCNKIKFIN